MSSCFFRMVLSRSNSLECLNVLSCSSGSSRSMPSAIFAISFMSDTASSARSSDCKRVTSSLSDRLSHFCMSPSFGAGAGFS